MSRGGDGISENTATLDPIGEVEENKTVTLTVTVASNYTYTVTLNGAPIEVDGTYTHTVKGNAAFVVTFEKQELQVEGVYTGKANLSLGGSEKSEYDARLLVKKSGTDAIDVILLLTSGDETMGSPAHLQKTEDGVYGSGGSGAPEFTFTEDHKVSFYMAEDEPVELERTGNLPATPTLANGTYRSVDMDEITINGNSAKIAIGRENGDATLVPVGDCYIVVLADDDAYSYILTAGTNGLIIVITGEEGMEFAPVAEYRNIFPTKALEVYNDVYGKLYVSADDQAYIQESVAKIKVNGEDRTYEDGKGFMLDGDHYNIQLELAPPAKEEYVIDWYDAQGKLLAKTTAKVGEAPATRYSVNVTGEHITVTFSVNGPYEANTDVTFRVTPDEGYLIDSVMNGETRLDEQGSNVYTVKVVDQDIEITVTTKLAPPVFHFDGNGAEGGEPSVEPVEPSGKRFSVKLPENTTYTAPAGKYFVGWEINEVTYYAGEEYDAKSGETVNVKAVWGDLSSSIELDVTDKILKWFTANSLSVSVADGKTVKVQYELTGVQKAFQGMLLDVAANGDFYRLCVDARCFYNTADTATQGTLAESLEIVKSAWDESAYLALFNGNGSAIQVVTLSLSNNVLTAVIATYASTDTELKTVVAQSTYHLTSKTDVSSMTVGMYIDGVDSGTTATNAMLSTDFTISDNQAPTEQDPVEIGTADNSLSYTDTKPVWTSVLRKGEKVVMKGTMTSTGAQNYHATGFYLFDKGLVPNFNFRADNFVNGNTNGNVNPFIVANGWKIAGTTDGSNPMPNPVGTDEGAKWWDGVRAIFKQADVEITYDYTGENIILTFVATSTNPDADYENYGKVYKVTFTVEKNTGAFADELMIGLGGEGSYTRITSLTRTAVREAPQGPLYNGGESDAVAHPGDWYWWKADGTGDWENGCVVTMNESRYDPFEDVITLNWNANDKKCWYGVQVFYENAELTNGQTYRLSFSLTLPGEEDDGKTYCVTVNGYALTLHGGLNHVVVVYTEPETENAASLSIQFGWNGQNDTMVNEAEVTISDWSWTTGSIVKEALQNLTELKIEATEGTYKATFTDPNTEGVSGYKLAFYETGEPDSAIVAETMLAADGTFALPEKLVAGTYYLRLQAMPATYLGYQTPSGWTNPAIEVNITGGLKKGEQAAVAANEIQKNAEKDATNNAFALWWVEGADWNCGTIVTMTPSTVNLTSDGKIKFVYSGGNMDYSVQLFYKNTSLTAQQYCLSFKVKVTASAAVKIIANGNTVTLQPDVEKTVEVLYMGGGDISSVDIQFPGTEFAGVSGEIAVELYDVVWYNVVNDGPLTLTLPGQGGSQQGGGGDQGGGQGGTNVSLAKAYNATLETNDGRLLVYVQGDNLQQDGESADTVKAAIKLLADSTPLTAGTAEAGDAYYKLFFDLTGLSAGTYHLSLQANGSTTVEIESAISVLTLTKDSKTYTIACTGGQLQLTVENA